MVPRNGPCLEGMGLRGMSDGGAGVPAAALWVVLLMGVVGCPFVAAQEAWASLDDVDPAASCDSRRNDWKCLHTDFVRPSPNDTMGGAFFTCPSGCEAVGQECCDPGCCAHMHGPMCVPFNVNTVNLVVVGDGTLARDQHVTLPVGSTVMVACRPGFIAAPDWTYTNDEAPLSCTPERAPYAYTELTCVHDHHKGPGSSGHGFGHSKPPTAMVGTGAGLAHDAISTDGNRAEPSAPDPEEFSHHGVGVTVMMLVMLGSVVATVVGKRKHQTSGGGPSDRRRIEDGWRCSTGSFGVRVAFGGSAAELSLSSSLISEERGMGYDAHTEARSDAPVVEASFFAPDSSDQESCSGTDVYTSGEEGTELEFQTMVPEILGGPSDSAFTR